MSILQINALKLNEKKRKLKFWNLALVCLLSLSQKLYEIKEICQHTTRNSQQSIQRKKKTNQNWMRNKILYTFQICEISINNP